MIATLVCGALQAQSTFQITTPSPLPDAIVNTTYSLKFQASGSTLPLSWFITAIPTGLKFDETTGVLSGTPTQTGTFTFEIHVGALSGPQVFAETTRKSFTLAVLGAASTQTTPRSLTFNGYVGGRQPPSQALSIAATTPGASIFSFTIDGGSTGSVAPPWLSASPASQAVPGRLTASVDITKAPAVAGSYTGRIRLSFSGTSATSDIPVTLVLTETRPKLVGLPSILRFTTLTEQALLVKNIGGGGPIAFTASPLGDQIRVDGSQLTTPSKQTPALLSVANTSLITVKKVKPRPSVVLRSADRDRVIKISLKHVKDNIGPEIALDQTGVRFAVLQGSGTPLVQGIRVLNIGTPGTTLQWSSRILQGADWLKLTAASGTATSASQGVLGLTVIESGAAVKPVGPSYALIEITSKGNNPRYVSAVLDVSGPGTPIAPEPGAAGLAFLGAAKGANPAPRTVGLVASSPAPVTISLSASTTDGGTWLSVAPASISASIKQATSFVVSTNTQGLKPGVYLGEVDLAVGTEIRAVTVRMVVSPEGTTFTTAAHAPGKSLGAGAEIYSPAIQAANCTPTRLVVTQTGLVNNFSIPTGLPAPLAAKVTDDCGSDVSRATVVAEFSNEDEPLELNSDLSTGRYSSTWQPLATGSPVAVTLTASITGLISGTSEVSGSVNASAFLAPTLVVDGLLNNLYPEVGEPLAPGTVVQLYGTNMANAADSPSTLPLPTNFKGVEVLIGGISAPIYYVSPNQLTIQIPSELEAPGEYQALISVNGAYSLPQPVSLVAVTPGVVAFGDGALVAQHTDYSLVDANKPAKPGETLVIYLVGMGATSLSVPSGTQTPTTQLISVLTPATVTIDGQTANTSFVGLTPGGIGLYQINLTVPTTAKAGKLPVVISQDGVEANPTTLLVQP